MRAIVIEAFGQSDSLSLQDMPQPTPQSDEVLIRVQAAGLNPIDVKTRQGQGLLQADALPLILGWDVSGTVEAIGDKVSKFSFVNTSNSQC